MGTISVEGDLCITMSALRGHASLDAPRPIPSRQADQSIPQFPAQAGILDADPRSGSL